MPTARVQLGFRSGQPSLAGVDPTFRPPVGVGSQSFARRGPGTVGARLLRDSRFGTIQPALKGVDPEREPGEQLGQPLNRNAETRMMVEREFMGRVSPTTLPTSLSGVRAFPSFGEADFHRSLDARQSFRPVAGIGAESFRGAGPAAIGARPFIGRAPQLPLAGSGSEW